MTLPRLPSASSWVLKPNGWQTVAVTATIVLALMALFMGPLFGDECFLFRDSAHYYPPLWRWQNAEWGAQRIPLWNPLQNLGEPHLADNTSCLFYPGKLVFALPLEFETAFAIFLVAHLGLAAWTMFHCGRVWGLSVFGSGIAAASYSLGGSILFLHTNPPMLIGAAWLPLALESAWELISNRSLMLRSALRLSIVLSLMLLGGDAQMVYHVGLIMILLLFLWGRRSDDVSNDGTYQPRNGYGSTCLRFALVMFITATLSAIQLLPTAQQSLASDRMTSETWKQRFVADAPPESHANRVYDFSVAPWRLSELLWPNAGGKRFPRNGRWMDAIPAEGRMWSPSLYVGLIPITLAVHYVWFRRRSNYNLQWGWIVWFTGLAIFAAFGRYGLGWLAAETELALTGHDASVHIGWPFGGLYWLMNLTLPFYHCFRYPAKWWVIANGGISLLAARGWDQIFSIEHEATAQTVRFMKMAFAIALFSGALAIGTLAFAAPRLTTWLAVQGVDDPFFGPLDPHVAVSQLVSSMLHTTIVALLTAVLVRRHLRFPRPLSKLDGVMFGICAIDLCLANGWCVLTGNVSTPEVTRWWVSAENNPPERIHRPSLMPPASIDNVTATRWARHNRVRIEHMVAWQQHTLYSQFHHDRRWGKIDCTTTIPTGSIQRILNAMQLREREHRTAVGGVHADIETGVDTDRVDPRLLAWWGVSRIIDSDHFQSVVEAAPRVRIATSVTVIPATPWSLAEQSLISQLQGKIPLEAMLSRVTIASNEPLAGPDMKGGVATISRYTPCEVIVEVTSHGPGVLVLGELFADGWYATAQSDRTGESRRLKLYRADGVFRAVYLTGDETRVIFVYRPKAFYVGASLSGIGWLCALGFCIHVARCAASSACLASIAGGPELT